jgi:uncharacterized membrane protein YjfL (UPF0719 family)
MAEIFRAYLITFGWAIIGSVSMGLGIIVTLKMFDLSTRNVDEWQLVKDGNIPIAIILAAVILALGIVVADWREVLEQEQRSLPPAPKGRKPKGDDER